MGRIAYFLSQAVKHIRRNPVVAGVTVATVAVVFLVLGVLLLAGHNLQRLADRLESGLEISVFIKAEASQENRRALQAKLRNSPLVAKVQSVSPKQALLAFRQSLGEQASVLDELGEDLLPASFRASFKPEGHDARAIRRLAKSLEGQAGVEEVQYGQGWFDRFLAFMAAARMLGALIGGLIVLATLLVVSNTIRLSVFSRREEVEIFRLVGATEFFLRTPFYFEGVMLGALGAAAGLGMTWLLYILLGADLRIPMGPGEQVLVLQFLAPWLAGLVVLGGALVGLLGTSASLGRHMRA